MASGSSHTQKRSKEHQSAAKHIKAYLKPLALKKKEKKKAKLTDLMCVCAKNQAPVAGEVFVTVD